GRDVSGTDPFDELGQVRDGGRGEFGLGRADEDAGAASSLDPDLAPPREACAQGWSPEALDPIERETSHTSEREADRGVAGVQPHLQVALGRLRDAVEVQRRDAAAGEIEQGDDKD